MRDFLVTRHVVTDDEGSVTPVNFTVRAVTGPDAARFADNAKRTIEANAGLVAPVSERERTPRGTHLPFAGLRDLLNA